jgi:truncated hemoglobin YjbI
VPRRSGKSTSARVEEIIDLATRLSQANGQGPLEYLEGALREKERLQQARKARTQTVRGRLGGAGGVARIVDGDPGLDVAGLYERITGRRPDGSRSARCPGDPELSPYFARLGRPGAPKWKDLRWHLRVFLDLALGGNPAGGYRGRDLDTVHADLLITGSAFDHLTGHVDRVLADLKVSPQDRKVVYEAIETVRVQIVSFPDL